MTMPSGTDPGGQSGQQTPPAPPAPGGGTTDPGPQATLTQEQVNALLAEERRKAGSKFSDYDQMKARLAELEAAGQSEAEKTQARLEAATKERDKALADRNHMLIRSELTAAAMKAGAVDPDVVVALLSGQFKVTDKGELDGDVAKAVHDLIEARPYLKAANTPITRGSADGGRHSGNGGKPGTPTSTMNDALRASRR